MSSKKTDKEQSQKPIRTLINDNLLKELSRFCDSQEIPKNKLLISVQSVYAKVCQAIHEHFIKQQESPLLVGLNGPQGSGKSTLAEVFKLILKYQFNLNCIHFSIDDIYKTRQQRQQLSEKTHPLFITRGVPGTHDIYLGLSTLKQLKQTDFSKTVTIPRFSKALDDRMPASQWQHVLYKPDIIIFEGWCVGSKPQEQQQLIQPINQLEAQKDSNLTWRKAVNQYLDNDYQRLFKQIDFFIYLAANNFDNVYQWRQEQEYKLFNKLQQKNKKSSRVMNDKELKYFMQHFERITLHNFKTLPQIADYIIYLSEDRTPSDKTDS
ncbi:hypothetical protein [Aliikangiella sp. IMCC44359]|uniref:hypothetical protein n=1 Tax=Aliikangiella sp. IMCC44359 TaxID=3459125 RepID=UPI00403A8FED